MDGQEAARAVAGMQERELQVAVQRIAGVVDIGGVGGRRGRKEAEEEIEQRRRHP